MDELFKRYCIEELEMTNPTPEQVQDVRNRLAEHHGSVEESERIMTWYYGGGK